MTLTVCHALAKVPEVTALFWVTKVLTTAMGESTSDFLTHTMAPEIAVVLALVALVAALALQLRAERYVALVAALALQLRAERYVPWIYWLAVAMVSVFGTMAADALHQVGIPYVASTLFYAVVLAAIFWAWQRTEGTLSIHSIRTPRRELFYWATVLATFALGTAAGDMTATTLHLGYLASGVLFAVIIAIPAVAHARFGMNAILAFWFAYVVTRPLGASFADWAAVSPSRGGLGLGTGPVSLLLALLIVGCVAYLTVSADDVVEPAGEPALAEAE